MRPGEWDEVAAGFRDYLLYTAGRSEQTVRVYLSSLHLFWDWCSEREEYAPEADRVLVQAWRKARTDEASPSTIHGNIAALRAYYKWLSEYLEQRTDNPALKITVRRSATRSTDPLEPNELTALFAACANERDRLIILFLCYSGVRITEFADMRAEHIDWQHGTIVIYGKGGTVANIKPSAEVMFRLRSYVGLLPEGPIWRSMQNKAALKDHQVRKIIYRLAEKAGVRDVHPHRFRATFGCTMIEQTGDLHATMGAMRHKSPDTTTRYLKKVEERRALEKMQALSFAI